MYVDPSGYGSVTYTDRPIYIDGKKIGRVSYKTGEYLKVQISDKFLPAGSMTSGFNIGIDTRGDIYIAFRERNGLVRGKNIENIVADTVSNQYIQIGDGLDGKFPVIDLSNSVEAVSIKSLNEFCKSYRYQNGQVNTDEVCKKLMEYYNEIDDITISINDNTDIDKTLLAILNGKNSEKLKLEIQNEMNERIDEKYKEIEENDNKRTKCRII